MFILKYNEIHLEWYNSQIRTFSRSTHDSLATGHEWGKCRPLYALHTPRKLHIIEMLTITRRTGESK